MTKHTEPVPLVEARDSSAFGGKAAHLAVAARTGLPVPPGLALPWPLVRALAAGDAGAPALDAARSLGGPLAVRSSAVDEDSEGATFAGQHVTLLNVSPGSVLDAVRSVAASARDHAALAYRRRLGLGGEPRMGVLVQSFVVADVAGVLFDPGRDADSGDVLVEAAWGLGEAVVAGLVTPDLFRLGPGGEVLERRFGRKDVEVVPARAGGTTRRPVPPDRVRAPCLDDSRLAQLLELAAGCRSLFGGSQDVEWAFAGDELWLLQRRVVTAPLPR